jgi:hypothetical protein
MSEDKPEIHDGITREEVDDNIYRVFTIIDPFNLCYNNIRKSMFDTPFHPYRNPLVKKKNPRKAKQAAQRQARKITRNVK